MPPAASPSRRRNAEDRLRGGMDLFRRGKVHDAEQEILRAVKLDPSFAGAWVNLGGLLLSRWDFRGCIKANRRALKCDPKLLSAHYNLGLGQLYLNRPAEVVKCFTNVVGLDPRGSGGHYYLAVGLFARGRAEEARDHLASAMQLGFAPDPEFVQAVGQACGGGNPVYDFSSKKGNDSKTMTRRNTDGAVHGRKHRAGYR